MKKLFLICIFSIGSLVTAASDSYQARDGKFILVQIQVNGHVLTVNDPELENMEIKVNGSLYSPKTYIEENGERIATGVIEKGISIYEYEVTYSGKSITKVFEFNTFMLKKDYPGNDIEFHSEYPYSRNNVIRIIFDFNK
ncbi:MAG: hypothetical protein A2381_04220 [Bdellovibrionales bacterium RIFOXYB1_FULL_37_110]|nr:MAG: hypothetical protein A2417_03485 [Bdellovibrionales bacterium RIFOXYC1_FULL_37_79]OFZ57397.1 MAG: hypothetical protein A2381_04220 [Bdellovibrionales bacterium RIFOXYB1_FULL_37_110]OFZ64958.1 MAG: hypothetical protein A2577_02705 [Bdellovibrionales bacterium RIFOXYD1_FULL_36_51]